MNARKTVLALCIAAGSAATLVPSVSAADIFVRVAPPPPRTGTGTVVAMSGCTATEYAGATAPIGSRTAGPKTTVAGDAIAATGTATDRSFVVPPVGRLGANTA